MILFYILSMAEVFVEVHKLQESVIVQQYFSVLTHLRAQFSNIFFMEKSYKKHSAVNCITMTRKSGKHLLVKYDTTGQLLLEPY